MHVEEQIRICRQANKAALRVSDVSPGDVFFATRYKVPVGGLRRQIWNLLRALESINPALKNRLARLGSWTPWADDLERLADFQLDGNNFAAIALEAGAEYAFVDQPAVAKGPRYILVEDAQERLLEIASALRREVDIPTVALTGTVGKTTTKKLVAAVLARKFNVSRTDKSYNSAPEISRIVISDFDRAEAFVLEFGGLALYTIARLCEIAAPTHGILTRVGIGHLNTYGSIEALRKGKWELPEYLLANGGHFFQNLDDAWIREQPVPAGSRTTYGTSPDADIRGEFISADPFLKLRWFPPEGRAPIDIQTRLFGRYNTENVLAAIAAGVHFGVEPEAIADAIASCPPADNRSQMVRKGSNRFILDSGSVTPTSLEAALANFGSLQAAGKIVVLADMLRLGGYTPAAHREAIRHVQSLGFEQAVFVGENYWAVRDERAGLFFRNTPELRRWWQTQHFENKTFLVKGAIRFRLTDVLGV